MSDTHPPRDEDLSLAAAKRIDRVCRDFEASLRGGRQPRLEECLAGLTDGERPALLVELLHVELEYRREQGERPTPAEYLERLPSHEAEVRGVFGECGGEPSGRQRLTSSYRGNGEQGETAVPAVPGYEILEWVKSGGMGVVYRARDLALDRVVALKVIKAGRDLTPSERERFRREAQAAARLKHPHIVPVYAFAEHDGVPYLAMEFVEGTSLAGRLRIGRPWEPAKAAALVADLAAAVAHAHEHGVVHRDLKPGNVLLDEAGHCYLTDFGLARLLDNSSGLTGSGAVLGTPDYISPEQAEGDVQAHGPATDVFGLGAILYHLLTGQSLYPKGETKEVIRQAAAGNIRDVRAVNSAVPEELARACRKALDREPTRRHRTVAELEQELRAFLRPRLDRRMILLAAGLLVGAGLGLRVWVPWKVERAVGGTSAAGETEGEMAPLRVKLRVIHLQETRKEYVSRWMGKDVFGARFNDKLQVRVELSEPAYAYLLALNPNGKEQLCLPDDGKQPPKRTDRLDYPSAGVAFRLDDGVGLQAFVVVASRQQLPTYDEWPGRQAPREWRKLPAKAGAVYRGDGERLAMVVPGGDERGTLVKLGEVKPLEDVCQQLRAAPRVEAIAVEAFAVLARRDGE